MKVSAVIAAGGKGTRMGSGRNKIFLEIGGESIISRTVGIFEKNPNIFETIIVTGKDDIPECEKLMRKYKKITVVTEGGSTRQESVYNGLKFAKGHIIAIHDAARCMVSDEIINAAIEEALKYGAAAPGVLCKDTLKIADDKGFIQSTVDRSRTYQIQTPQVFMEDIIRSAHENGKGVEATDDCALVEMNGVKVKITEGSYENIKLTTPEDIIIGEGILKRRCM